MAATGGTITVKLHLDTTEFFAELARVQEAILDLDGLGKDPDKTGAVERLRDELVEGLKRGASIAPRVTIGNSSAPTTFVD